MLGKAAALALGESDIQSMDIKEAIDCIETFGNLDLEPKVRISIWDRIGKVNPVHTKKIYSSSRILNLFKIVLSIWGQTCKILPNNGKIRVLNDYIY